MATTRRNSSDAPPELAELTERLDQLEKIQTITLRVLARASVQATAQRSNQAATFKTIITNELRIATHEEAAAIEAWITAHQGG